MAVREQAVVAHHLDRPVERHGVHVRAQQHGGRALGPGMRASRLPESDPVAARCRPPRPRCRARADSSVSASRHRALAPRRALDLAVADEFGEQPLALLAGQRRGSRRRTLPLDRPALALPARDAAVHHVDHLARAEPLAAGSRAIAARCPDAQITATGRSASSSVRQLVDVVVGRCGPSPGCGPRPTPSARARRAAGARSSRRPSARAARPRSAARTRSTGCFSSRQEVMPPAR